MEEQQGMGRRHAIQAVAAASVGAALTGAAVAGGSAQGSGAVNPIVGTWYMSSPGPSTALIQTFHADGTFLSVHDQHTFRGAQPGVWEQIGPQEYLMRNLSFRFDSNGVRNGSVEIRSHITLDPSGMQMRSRGTRLELDLDGNLLQPPISWTAEAMRMVVVPVD